MTWVLCSITIIQSESEETYIQMLMKQVSYKIRRWGTEETTIYFLIYRRMYIWYQDDLGVFINRDYFDANLKDRYTLKNLEKVKLLQRNEWRARNMPDFFEMYTYKFSQWVVQVPPGILSDEWSKIEKRFKHPIYPQLDFFPTLRDDQMNAINNLKKAPVWLLHGGTGIGKSYIILYLAAKIPKKTLIIVNATTTLNEMVKKCIEFTGHTPSVFGGKTKYKPTTDKITIALINSVHKAKPHEHWAILADECDLYISTELRQKLWFHCSPDYCYGLSATLKVNMQEERLINLFFGKVEDSLYQVQIMPKIKMIQTRYKYPYAINKESDFGKLQTHISENVERNTFIVDTIYASLPQTETKKALLLTKRTEQATVFKDMLTAKGIESHVIIGETPDEERQEIISRVTNTTDNIVLIWSAQILWRWFDLPALQTVYIQSPNRFEEALQQVVGRVLRLSPGKTYAQVYDFMDPYEKALRNQAEFRKRVYRKKYGAQVN